MLSKFNDLISIRGNHDGSIVDKDITGFSYEVATFTKWTKNKIDGILLKYIKTLEKGPKFIDNFAICHGSSNYENRYLLSSFDTNDQFV